MQSILIIQVGGGIAYRNGMMQAGDQILTVNGVDFRTLQQQNAVELLSVCLEPIIFNLPIYVDYLVTYFRK